MPDPIITPAPKDDFLNALEAAGQSAYGEDVDLSPILGTSGSEGESSKASNKAFNRVPDLWASDLYVATDDISRRYTEDRSSDIPRALRMETDRASIARELGLSARLSREDIYRIRREFALSNHPDLFDSSLRETATQRMTIANMLIDDELRKRG